VLSSVLAGLGLGLSLIIAIGAQNMFVLRQGLRREHILTVVLICTASDAVLILLGVSGIGLALQALPWLVEAVRWLGAAFLLVYAALAARRAIRPTGEALHAASTAPSNSPVGGGAVTTATRTGTALAPIVLTCLALTWLNPHVYLDTVFLLGTVANSHGDGRWAFALGAVCASALWFFGLGFGARLLGRWLATPRAWRIVDGVIAVIMAALAVNLVLGA